MARKRPVKKRTRAKAAKSGAVKPVAKKAAPTHKTSKAAPARKASKKSGSPAAKKAVPAAKKARAAKAARRAAAKKASVQTSSTGKKAVARKIVTSKTAAKKPAAAKAASRKTAVAGAKKAQPAPRRSAPRISAGRRASARKTASRETLAKKTLAKPAAVARKPAKKQAAKRAAAGKAQPGARAASKSAGKTARGRIVARASQKLVRPVLRDGARRRVVEPTAPRPEKPATPKRRPPFRLHALGVREEHRTDQARVEALLVEAFGRPDEARIVERLRADRDIAFALVAEYEGELVGHIAFSSVDARIDGRPVKALALAPLAVTPGRQGRGVGSALVAAGLEAARTAGYQAVFVVGDAAYYQRFGFSAEAAQPFQSEWKSALTAMELEPQALAGAAGVLIHAAALRG